MSTTNKEVKYGTVEVPEEDFERKGAKVRISMMIDEDLLDLIKERAASEGEKYQPWIQKRLRELVSAAPNESRRVMKEELLDKLIRGQKMQSAELKKIISTLNNKVIMNVPAKSIRTKKTG